MKRIVIENIDESDGPIEEAVRLVADAIEDGCTNGIVGWSSATWYIEEED